MGRPHAGVWGCGQGRGTCFAVRGRSKGGIKSGCGALLAVSGGVSVHAREGPLWGVGA